MAASDPGEVVTLSVTGGSYGLDFAPPPSAGQASNQVQVVAVANTTQLRTKVINPPVANDGDAIIATQPFLFQVEAYNSTTNQRVTGVSGTVYVTFESGPGGETIPGQISLTQGAGTVSMILNAVNGTSQTRSYTVNSSFAVFSGAVNVWFSVLATREGLVGQTTSCQHVIAPNDNFIALPATISCGTGVNLRSSAGAVVSSVLDVGPWYPHSQSTPGNPCVGPSDPYWNTTGVPRASQDTCSNGAGVDLADGTFSDLGLTGNGQIIGGLAIKEL